jgi:hypothetical protein
MRKRASTLALGLVLSLACLAAAGAAWARTRGGWRGAWFNPMGGASRSGDVLACGADVLASGGRPGVAFARVGGKGQPFDYAYVVIFVARYGENGSSSQASETSAHERDVVSTSKLTFREARVLDARFRVELASPGGSLRQETASLELFGRPVDLKESRAFLVDVRDAVPAIQPLAGLELPPCPDYAANADERKAAAQAIQLAAERHPDVQLLLGER